MVETTDAKDPAQSNSPKDSLNVPQLENRETRKLTDDDLSNDFLKRKRKLVRGNVIPNEKYSAFSLSSRDNEDGIETLNEEAPKVELAQKPAWMTEDAYRQHKEDEKSVKQPVRRRRQKLSIEEQKKQAEQRRLQEEKREEKAHQQLTQASHEISSHSQYSQTQDIVRSHYNARTHLARKEDRNKSPIIKLRQFNNIIKYMLILMFSKPNMTVLDLGCGKGGDLYKWQLAKTSLYIGIDLSDQSIIEAIHRYRRSRNVDFRVAFITGDAFETSVEEIVAGQEEAELPVDIVSMQFCMHYAFESEAKARKMLENVSHSLKRGGYFIGTIPSSDFIIDKIKDLPEGEKKWGNGMYSVEFQNPPPRDGVFRPPFGNMYTYFLQDAVDNVPEYVVPFEAFRALALEYDLELRYSKPFLEMFDQEFPKWNYKLPQRISAALRQQDGSYQVFGAEREAISFYKSFAFEKMGM
ncbi:Methyltransferase [Komagataella phaffii CBS 7435]|uniref:mRNA cap guanine-N(7) methyltransferase n=1 Tax=Komagataella phaffii (strain ATCC 76273 / CBS 7435 / CECT 11047 / NRRL Y-11430 / Wegner 21-1) TaxID=981350 RepID=F2QVT6_KOMPC|nr:GQ67_03730T0 [Komagataella phaffii]AOA68392.1 GQ68_03702T0 [Komagataella phaffii GS115]CAH2449532.1 Methyltransferase [Komagataella phaffii CBS 7435]CCA39514.1 Methyltransferase [Komagataella phaffii CBS 7435]